MLGVTCCGVSNNHFFDYGLQGVADTFAALEKAGLQYTGYGENYEDSRKNLVIEAGGERLCIIAVCEHEYSYAFDSYPGCRPYDEYDTMEDIRKAKASCDRVVVIYHGGKELCGYPSPRLYRLCHAMARNGADVVLTQHSHCIGCYEQYDGCHILYGQGNFHFVKPNEDREPPRIWNSCLAVQYDTKENRMEFVPLMVKGKGIGIADGSEKEWILSEFARRNLELADGRWKEGWHSFCESVKDWYVQAAREACTPEAGASGNALFGHYLDCEAHTDVWRELFPTANITRWEKR